MVNLSVDGSIEATKEYVCYKSIKPSTYGKAKELQSISIMDVRP